MKKEKMISSCILLFVSVFLCVAYFSLGMKTKELSSIMLANIEALGQNEYDYDYGSAQKVVNTYDSDPTYTVSPDGKNLIENIFVLTETSCYGSGIIKCDYDFNVDLSTRILNPE